MFKKVSVLTFMLLYLVTASGFALNLHYCGNVIASVKINQPAKKCSPVKMKCCHDKHVEVKVKDAHEGQPAKSFLAKLFYLDLPKLPFEDFFMPAQDATADAPTDRGPPDRSPAQPVYLKNCTFRI
jgi:hypothetical protein